MLDDRYMDDSPMGKALASFGIQGTMARGQQAGEQVVKTIQEGGLKAAPGAALQALMTALDEPREQLTRMLGSSPQAVDQFGGDIAERLGAPRGLGEFGASVLSDPTTYMGLGLGKAAVKGAARAGLKEANPFMKVLQGAAKADESFGEAGEKAAGALVSAIQSGLVPANKSLGKMFPQLPKWTEYANKSKALTEAVQFLEERHGLDLPTAQQVWTKGTRSGQGAKGSIDDLYALLSTNLRQDFTKDDLLKFMQDATLNNKTTFADAVPEYLGAMKKGMGLKTDAGFARMYEGVTNWWKRQALGSVGQVATNLTGGMFMNALEGTNPLSIAKDVWDNKGAILRGDKFDVADAAKMEAKTGIPIPAGLDMGAGASALSAAGGGISFKPKAVDVGLGAGLGALSNEDDPLTGALVGGAGGAALAPFTSKIRQVGQGIETAMRQRTYTQGMGKELIESLDAMEVVVRDALNQQRKNGSVPGQAVQDIIMKIVQDSGGELNVPRLSKMLENAARLRPEVVDDLASKLDDIFQNASQKGVDKSNAANFDYQDLSNIERIVSKISPFSIWTMKAVPQLAEKAGGKPAIMGVPLEWNRESEEDRAESGLTSRVAGQMENPIGSKLMSAILGRDVKTFQNPFQQFIPFADASRGLSNLEYSETPGAAAVGLLDMLGLGINPLIEAPLRISGALGPSAPAEGLGLRAAPLVNALTGVDLNEGGKKIESSLRENLTGRQPLDLNQAAVAKRLDELALRETGTTIGSGKSEVAAYVRAKASQSGPLWDKAQKEVEAERNLNAVGGFVSPNLRGTVVTPQEEQIRQATTTGLVEKDTSTSIRDLAQAKPKADAPVAHTKAVLDAMDKILAQTGKTDLPQEVQTRLRNPTNENISWISGQIFAWEADHDPLKRGYAGSGSPEQRAIQAGSAALGVAGQGQHVPAGTPGPQVFKVAKAQKVAEQDLVKARTERLPEYLAWKKLNPGGTPELFLAQSH